MSKVHQGRKQHRSMRGKTVDMDLLRKRNELTPAAGNARVNARGDELGPGGKIIRKREDIVKEHYAQAGKAVSAGGRQKPAEEVVIDEPLTEAEQELLSDDEEWIEDDDGNFVKK